MNAEEMAGKIACSLADSNFIKDQEIQLMGDQINVVTPDGAFALTVRKFEV